MKRRLIIAASLFVFNLSSGFAAENIPFSPQPEMASGDELVIEFDCTQATEAIPQWAAEEGHAITDYQQIGDAAWSITVQKA